MNNDVIGELREFKRAALERLDKIEDKLETYNDFRNKLIGGAILVSFIISTMIQMANRIFK